MITYDNTYDKRPLKTLGQTSNKHGWKRFDPLVLEWAGANVNGRHKSISSLAYRSRISYELLVALANTLKISYKRAVAVFGAASIWNKLETR